MGRKRCHWLGACIGIILSISSQPLWAEASLVDDKELATVKVGQDTTVEVERKLGSACLVPSASGTSVSYLYNIKVDGVDGAYGYLRLEINGQVDAITISKDPPLSGVCYAPLSKPIPLQTVSGLVLGSTQDNVLRLYGQPAERLSIGRMTRFRYMAMLDRPYEWDVVFRDGRLVEWTVAMEE